MKKSRPLTEADVTAESVFFLVCVVSALQLPTSPGSNSPSNLDFV